MRLLRAVGARDENSERLPNRYGPGRGGQGLQRLEVVQRLQGQGPGLSLSVLAADGSYLRIAVAPPDAAPSLSDEKQLAAAVLPKL